MTRPSAASEIARPERLGLRPFPGELVVGATAQMLDPRVWARTRFLVDLLMLTLAASAAVFAAPQLGTGPNRLLAAAFPLLAVAILHARRGSDDQLHASILDTEAGMFGAISSAAVLTIAAGSVLGGSHSVGLTLRLWLFAVVYAGLARAMLVSVRSQAVANRALAVPTLILGAGAVGDLLVRRLSEHPAYGMRPVGFLDANPLPRSKGAPAPTVPVLGAATDLADAVAQSGARRVILAFSSEPDRVLVERVGECQKLGVEVLLVPRLFESINQRATLDHVGDMPVLSLRPTDPKGWQFAVKHGLDRCFALFLLIALAPLLALIALLVRRSSEGPILFRQQRIGRDGREFTMLKFRTMRGDPADSGEADAAWAARTIGAPVPAAAPPEDRTTAIGQFMRHYSLDELPQLINVLRGEMSFVGPRPERVSYVHGFENAVYRYADRHRVKSGLTGLAQVNGLRGETPVADRVSYDNYYIQNWSLGLDLKIVMMTFGEILRLRDSQKARKDAIDPSRLAGRWRS